MTSSSSILKPHSLFENQTHEQFCEKIPEFYFRKEVPEDVIQNFEVVKALMIHSYFEYKFIDEALSKALTSFEMAMSIRYKDFYPPKKHITFDPLITSLSKKNLFDTSIHQLKGLRDMRNHFAHPKQHGFGGVAYWKGIELILRIVNEMYEDIDLRLDRMKLRDEFLKFQVSANLADGLVLDIDGNRSILHRLQLLFINNKFEDPSYFFAFTPIFEYSSTENGSFQVNKSKLTKVELNTNSFCGESFSAKLRITFSNLSMYPDLKKLYENWISGYKSSDNKVEYESLMDYLPSHFLSPELRQFHKM